MRLRRPLPAVQGDTLHIVGVGDNRIGKEDGFDTNVIPVLGDQFDNSTGNALCCILDVHNQLAAIKKISEAVTVFVNDPDFIKQAFGLSSPLTKSSLDEVGMV